MEGGETANGKAKTVSASVDACTVILLPLETSGLKCSHHIGLVQVLVMMPAVQVQEYQ